ncbi:MAG: BMP family ABC transporter substrate-binding protein, partial [Lachnospiraceae bacterium]|nr:BMP family ABC transporter substrate-binding protein [Lachnospiraceae bacterium]
MKKLLTLLLSVSMVATLLVGCGGAKTEEAPATEEAATTETTETTEEGLKIAIVSSPSGVDDGSFNQNNYEGILA